MEGKFLWRSQVVSRKVLEHIKTVQRSEETIFSMEDLFLCIGTVLTLMVWKSVYVTTPYLIQTCTSRVSLVAKTLLVLRRSLFQIIVARVDWASKIFSIYPLRSPHLRLRYFSSCSCGFGRSFVCICFISSTLFFHNNDKIKTDTIKTDVKAGINCATFSRVFDDQLFLLSNIREARILRLKWCVAHRTVLSLLRFAAEHRLLGFKSWTSKFELNFF